MAFVRPGRDEVLQFSPLDLYAEAGIQLRLLPNLLPFWTAVTGNSLGFSGIRLANASPV